MKKNIFCAVMVVAWFSCIFGNFMVFRYAFDSVLCGISGGAMIVLAGCIVAGMIACIGGEEVSDEDHQTE